MITPLTDLPWHVIPDEDDGAWLCAQNGSAVAYVEHVADADFLIAAVRSYAKEVSHAD